MNGIYLTKKEQEILEWWAKFEEEHKNMPPAKQYPTFNQAEEGLKDKTHSYIALRVKALVEKGLMTKKQVKGRMGNVYSVKNIDD